jgi:hypothetical protein
MITAHTGNDRRDAFVTRLFAGERGGGFVVGGLLI